MTTMHLTATTTTSNEQVIISRAKPAGSSITIYWGDSNSTVVSIGDGGFQTHVYTTADTYSITIIDSDNIVEFGIGTTKISGFNSSELSAAALTYFHVDQTSSVTVNSSHMTGWSPTNWQLSSSSGTFTIDSSHMTGWNPDYFYLANNGAGTYTIDTAHMTSWTPLQFDIHNMPSGIYNIDSEDMASWNPDSLIIYSVISTGTIAIDTADMISWTPNIWRIYLMTTGTYVINSSHMSGWDPVSLVMYSLPVASTTWTISANDFAGFGKVTNIYIHNNGLTQAQVDAVLYGMYQASIIPRTATGGAMYVGGTNEAPSGTFQTASSCPVTSSTPGLEVAHELLNDGCAVGFNKWGTVSYTSPPAEQVASPTGDISIGQWTDQDLETTDLYLTLADETDATYVISESAPDGDILEVSLSGSVEFPETYQDHFVDYRYKKDYIGGPQIDLKVTLMCGSTEIAYWEEEDIGSDWTDQERELTWQQASSITDYTNLRLRFQATQGT